MKRLLFLARSDFFAGSVLLCFAIISGLVVGSVAAAHCCELSSAMMLRVPGNPLSIVGSLCVWVAPLILSLTAAMIHKRFLIPVAFMKSFCIGMCLCLCTGAFGGSGWLIRLCLLFTDICSFPVLCWIWLCRLKNDAYQQRLKISVALLVIISAIDCLLISPNLVNLIESI